MTSVANAVFVSSAKGSGYGTYGCYGVTVNEREHLFACEGLHKSIIIIEPLQNVTEKSTLSSFLPVRSQFILVVQLVLGLGAGSVAVDFRAVGTLSRRTWGWCGSLRAVEVFSGQCK